MSWGPGWPSAARVTLVTNHTATRPCARTGGVGGAGLGRPLIWPGSWPGRLARLCSGGDGRGTERKQPPCTTSLREVTALCVPVHVPWVQGSYGGATAELCGTAQGTGRCEGVPAAGTKQDRNLGPLAADAPPTPTPTLLVSVPMLDQSQACWSGRPGLEGCCVPVRSQILPCPSLLTAQRWRTTGSRDGKGSTSSVVRIALQAD